MGPEAPLVQTTGSLASWAASRWGLNRDETRILTITGMAAGFTVLFGAPLGSAVFALEILHRRGLEYYEALMPAVVGSLIGYGAYVVTTGAGLSPVWHFPAVGPAPRSRPAVGARSGRGGAAISVAFTYFAPGCDGRPAIVPPLARPILGGAHWGPWPSGRPTPSPSARPRSTRWSPTGPWPRCSWWRSWPSCAGPR